MPTTPFSNLFAGQSPFAPSVTAGINGNPVNFASPGAPNVNYSTQQAAEQLARFFGGNAVRQNLTNMASPGSPAPSQPMYGVDFGNGFVSNAGNLAFKQARGDSPESIQRSLAAERNTTGWGGPAPVIAPNADVSWETTSPISQNPLQAWAKPAAAAGPQQTAAQWQAANQRPVNTNGNPTWNGLSPELQNLYLRFALENARASGQPGW